MTVSGHGGLAAAKALAALGVEHLFTLSGGHIFPIFDGCKSENIRLIDVRHEQTAGYGAEATGRLTRNLGACAVTAGPGVTNVMSPLAQASFNQAPMLVLGGRAPQFRWGQGSLQEIDHVPFVNPIAPAKTVFDTVDVAREVVAAGRAAMRSPRGPRFLDLPLDVVYNVAAFEVPEVGDPSADVPDENGVGRVAELVAASQRPIVIAGSNVWLDAAEQGLVDLVEKAELPVFMNGQGRGCVPADHRLAFSRSRSTAIKEADLVLIVGTPIDFRLNFGQGFAPDSRLVYINPSEPPQHVEFATQPLVARTDLVLHAIADEVTSAPDTKAWVEKLRAVEEEKRAKAQAELTSTQTPIHPMRVYGELVPLLDRDAVVIGDGGDFVSFAGKEVPSFEGGRWLDPGPFGCLGAGPGYAMAARLVYPDSQVVLLYGDGAIGFSLGDLETMVRLRLPVVCVVGNNGIWALEKHPMRGLYGYDVAADLQPGLRYDQVMEAFGGRGELVTDPDDIAPALKRAFDSGEPSLVNIVTDPEVAYPRSANLA